jgi:hypothetical protein
MTELTPARVEQMEIIGPDYARAYSALARRVAAVDALLRKGCVASTVIHREITEAMAVIKQVETPVAVIAPPVDTCSNHQ